MQSVPLFHLTVTHALARYAVLLLWAETGL